ncbi:LytTR family DNA-binding domain-containing protein [Clostridium sp. Marseille-P2415]|uniref:LytTR family DNA-binding domain-containing protein n=1 Tax=Clostridium sp. Marseille-P2415 TaxID=1805471 RepID=UPI00135656B2|nr:LytTR family DNA-binding domain-containing protein [Clostridium sp. Marseille-P2415]
MKIVFYTNEKKLVESYFSMEDGLLPALERTACDMIVIYPKGETVSSREIVRQANLIRTKYTAFFNGQRCVLDTRDILFLESYYRKTSVVVKKGRIRIRARLDEEEKKFPNDQFIRINRHNIINMRYVRNVKGEAVEMQNGEVLYVNGGRKKKFEKKYRDFLKENCMLL